MRPEDRPRTRPEEWERPHQSGSDRDPRPDQTEPPTPTKDPSDAELPADHPFAELAGDNLDLGKAMAMALRVLRDHAPDPRLADRLQSAADGRTSLRSLVEDPAMDAAFGPRDQPESTAADSADQPDSSRTDDPADLRELLASRSIELPEGEQERAREAAQRLVARLTDDSLVDEVKARFGVE